MRVTFEVDGSRVAVDVDRVATRAFRDVLRVVDLGAEPIVVAAGRDVSATKAAALLGMSRAKVLDEIARGGIPARRVGTHWRLRLLDVLYLRQSLSSAAVEQAAAARLALSRDLDPGGHVR